MKKQILKNILEIFPGASEIIDEGRNVEFSSKEGNGNIVTTTDVKLEKYITDFLKKMYPDALIISEEMKDWDLEKADANIKFIIDPLDGTSNFIKKWPCSISIACILDNELVCGAIYEINTKNVYYAIKDEGAFKYNLTFPDTISRIENFPRKNKKLEDSIISYDFPYGNEAFEVTQKIVSTLYSRGASLKTIGPISLEILKNGLGEDNRLHDYNDLCWHVEVRPWDVAAATCIVRELKGEIISLKDGLPISCETLSNPEEKIAFAVSSSDTLLMEIYNIYLSIVNNNVKTFIDVMKKRR